MSKNLIFFATIWSNKDCPKNDGLAKEEKLMEGDTLWLPPSTVCFQFGIKEYTIDESGNASLDNTKLTTPVIYSADEVSRDKIEKFAENQDKRLSPNLLDEMNTNNQYESDFALYSNKFNRFYPMFKNSIPLSKFNHDLSMLRKNELPTSHIPNYKGYIYDICPSNRSLM